MKEPGSIPGIAPWRCRPIRLEAGIVAALKENSIQLVRESGVKGLVTLRYAVKQQKYYFRSFQPRFTRNIPVISNATGIDWVQVCGQDHAGEYTQRTGD